MALVFGVMARSSSSRSQRKPSDSCTGTCTGTAWAERVMASDGGHSGSGQITSSPGSSTACRAHVDAVGAAVGDDDLVVAADRDAVLGAQLLGDELAQARHAERGQVVRVVGLDGLAHALLEGLGRVEADVALVEAEGVLDRVHHVADAHDAGHRKRVEEDTHGRLGGSGLGGSRLESGHGGRGDACRLDAALLPRTRRPRTRAAPQR